MTTHKFRTMTAGLVALLASAGAAAAQGPEPALLNVLEVRELVDRGQPADHARLGAHFLALSDRYTAEAARHEAMARAFGGNPNRLGAAALAGVHYSRLAELNRESAAAVREVATHHEQLAAGIVSTVPAGSSRFHEGEGAPAPTDAELSALARSARTRADHLRLEEYFLTLSDKYTAEANQHAGMALGYRGTRIATAAMHCDRMVKLSRDSAKEAAAAATMHRQLAGAGE